MTQPMQYLSDSADPSFLVETLADVGPVLAGESEVRHRVYYDTFDWRLYRGGLRLWSDEAAQLRLEQLGSGQLRAVCQRVNTPAFAEDLPPGQLRDFLAPVLDMRALMPVVEVALDRQELRLLDELEKTVLRMVVERPDVARGDTRVPLGARIHLVPLRGYGEWLEPVCAALIGTGALREPEADLLEEVAAVTERPAGGYSSKLKIPLNRGLPAAEAVKRIHRSLLAAVETNIPGTRADIDSEFLHDLRVAVRRARSALTQVKGVLDPGMVAHFREELGWVGRITGPVRDLDVYLLEYEKYRASLPPAMRDDLGPLLGFLCEHKASAHGALCAELESERFQRLMHDWHYMAEHGSEPGLETPDADTAIEVVASRRIWRLYRRVRREGRAITPESPPEALHELRKSCKKLRYIIEFFRELFPDNEVGQLIKALKRLLDNLGEYQDLEVHAEHLRDYARQMHQEGGATVETLLAMGGLVADLLRRQELAREAFAKRFTRFDSRKNREAYRRLFKAVEEPA